MRKKLSKILITGGAGFIGSAFTRLAVRRGWAVLVVDKLTYASDPARLVEIKGKYRFYKADICDKARVKRIFEKESPDAIVNFAAETHVDRSIRDARPFIKTNVNGTQILLDISRRYGISKFIHISTDETYGEIKEGRFSENSPLSPNSPYAASKAAADLLIKSYIRTYGFPAIVIRPCNNYGPWQYPEKFIPLAILRILRGERIPVYGKGINVREWLYVTDCTEGILRIMEKGKIGEIYNLGSGQEKKNIDIAKMLLKILKKDNKSIEFVQDRPGHDIRYSLSSRKVASEIGWQPKTDLSVGLIKLVDWCVKNRDWLFSKYNNISSLYAKIRCGQ